MGGKTRALFNWLLGLTFLANLGVLFSRSLQAPLSTDDGYNLEVVDNLAQGKGYASYGSRRLDAWWSAQKLWSSQEKAFQPYDRWPFDPRITTGPAVLLPAALLWRWAPGNLTLLRWGLWGFLLAYLWALWRLSLHRQPLAFLSAAAVAGSLWFNFHPAALLGELPGAAFFLLGLGQNLKGNWFWAGVFLGLAVQSKLLYLFAAAVAVLYLLLRQDTSWGGRLRQAGLWAAGFALPLLAFEAYRLASLGSLQAFLASWQESLAFSREQTLGASVGKLLPAKMTSLRILGPGPWFFLAGALALFLALAGKPRGEKPKQDVAWALFLAGATVLAFWLLRSVQTSFRQALPAVLLGFPGLFLASRWWQFLPPGEQKASRLVALGQSIASCGLVASLVLSMASWTWRDFSFQGWKEGGIGAQQSLAKAIRASGAQALSPVVSWVEPFPLLTRLPVAPCPAPEQVLVVTSWAAAVEKKIWDDFAARCTQILGITREAKACLPNQELASAPAGPLAIDQWGPKETTLGQVPNPQGDKSGALWFRLASPVPSKPRVVLLLNGQARGLAVWSADGSWFSAPVPKKVVAKAGEVTVELALPCSGQTQRVGSLQVRAKN